MGLLKEVYQEWAVIAEPSRTCSLLRFRSWPLLSGDKRTSSAREDQARGLALRCREDAAKAGISSQDLEAAAEGNLIGNMLQALDAAEFRKMYRDQLAEQEED